MNIPKTTYEISYNGRNITGDILPFVLSLHYSDKAASESDELEIVVEDVDGFWRNEWYPMKGDTITARIIDLDQVLKCGSFTIDEITGNGSSEGDTVSIKGIAAGINKAIRTNNCYAHENKTLREIANTVASKHGFTVEGSIANVRIGRFHQYRETDLKALQRLANEYGYTFSMRDKKLIFTNIFEIESKQSALTITREEMIAYSITDKTSQTFQTAKVTYHNPKEKGVISFEQKETGEAFKTAKSDTLELKIKAENKQQAELKARVALYRANSLQQQGNVELPGNVFALAGNNCELVGIGMFSGLYYITTSTHSITKDGGYTTSIEVKRVGLVGKSKQK